MSDSAEGSTYWGGLARAYGALGHPLRPCAADIAAMEKMVADWAGEHRRQHLQALLLGVTPAIAKMTWPQGTRLLGIDNALAMVRAIWPGNVPLERAAIGASWMDLPIRNASCDIALGDGSFSVVRYPGGMREVAAEVRRVLPDDGMLILRSYIQPRRRERKEDLVAELLRGGMPSFHWFKYRLLMAMQESTASGVAVEAVYRFWVSQNIDEEALSARMGWDLAGIRMMQLYRGTDTVHTFSTLAELRAVLREFFAEVQVATPSGMMGDRCPILTARVRRNPRRARREPGVAECAV